MSETTTTSELHTLTMSQPAVSSSRQSVSPQRTHHAAYAPLVTDPLDCLPSYGGDAALYKRSVISSKTTRDYYQRQEDEIDSFLEVDDLRRRVREQRDTPSDEGEKEAEGKIVSLYVTASFITNVLILLAKGFLVYNSGSVTFIASLLDSVLDIMSGLTLVITNKMVNERNHHLYPLGKKTFEPLGTLVFSCCMFTASIQLLQHSATVLIKHDHTLELQVLDMILVGVIIVTKFILWRQCNRHSHLSNSISALAADHRNDVFSNTVGSAAAVAAVYFYVYIDPIVAILITIYIMKIWAGTGYEQIMSLSGVSAPSSVISQLTYTARHHHPDILFVDTVRAAALGGEGYQVEVDIVLDPETQLRKAHDIGESLQILLEKLKMVSRAYVHIDYEFDHSPLDHR